MQPSSDRPSRPAVEAVEYKGVKYRAQEGGMGGVLEAVDPATGKVLWTLQVYEIKEQSAPVDPMPIYFTRIKAGPGPDTLTIETEVDHTYQVDLQSRSSRLVSSPKPKMKFVAPE